MIRRVHVTVDKKMKLFRKFRAFFRKEKLDAEMSEEMRAHLELQATENQKRGMSADEARYAAQRAFGGVEQIKERARDERRRGWLWLDQLTQDLHYAWRQFQQAPGFVAVAMLSLSLGIGATTALFSVVNEALFKPLPVPHARELVRFTWAGNLGQIDSSFSDVVGDGPSHWTGASFSFFTAQRFQEQDRLLQSLFVFTSIGGHTIVADGQAEEAGTGDYVSAGYFEGLGVRVSLGRALGVADDRADAPLAVVLSDAYWRRRFGGDPAVIGKTILVNLNPATIVGVAPAEFRGVGAFGRKAALFLPLASVERINPGAFDLTARPGFRWVFGVMGRLRPGVSATKVEAEFAATFQRSIVDNARLSGAQHVWAEGLPPDFPRLKLRPGSNGGEFVVLRAGGELAVLAALAGTMLLIACTNVANLLLARGAARRREIAVRLALGAGRARLLRQLLTEALLLAGGGGALGGLFAWWGGDALAAMSRFSSVGHIEPDWRVFGFAVVASTLTGVLFGLVPAQRATRIDLNVEFQGGPRTTGSRSALRLGKTLMMVQVALSFVVLVGAGLFAATLRNLRAVDVGFPRERLWVFELAANSAGYRGERAAALFERVAAGLHELPGTQTVAVSTFPLVAGQGTINGGRIDGTPAGSSVSVAVNEVGGDFFATFDLPTVEGRTFTARDDSSAPKVAVVNRALVETIFGHESPLGRRIRFANTVATVVGVVRDVKYDKVREAVPATIYLSLGQGTGGRASFAVRSAAAPAVLASGIRRVVHGIEPNLPVLDLRTQDEQIERLFGTERMFSRLSILVGGVALLLVSVGLYGLMAYAVARRTGEIGVRMALGALPGRVFAMIVRESLAFVAAGLVVGVATAWAATRLIASLLFGLTPTDPLTYCGVALLLGFVALLAIWLPARRAAKVDPMVALRAE